MIHLTPDMMEGMYAFLRATPPFRAWRMPETDDVRFIVTRSLKDFGAHQWVSGHHEISASCRNIRLPATLMRVMAHEMCHVKEMMLGVRGDVKHGAVFNRIADQVCRYHGFDRGEF